MEERFDENESCLLNGNFVGLSENSGEEVVLSL